MHHAQNKSVHNTSTGVQNEIFIAMTILKPSVHQLHQHLWHVKKLVQKYKLASLLGAKCIVKSCAGVVI